MPFELSTGALAALLIVVTFGATGIGVLVGRRVRHDSDSFAEPYGALQGALLGVVGLILAFGLSLAVTRYEDRRDSIVAEANAIGTTYLRAQLLPEPERTESMRLLRRYTEEADDVAQTVPGSDEQEVAIDHETELQHELWRLAGTAVAANPNGTVPRLYIETLNETIDAQTSRVAALGNRVPNAVLLLEIIGACVALALLAGYLTLIGRGTGAVFIASAVVAFLLFITADLDRPTRGIIQVPDTVLQNELEFMDEPPAAEAPPPREN